jgi:hypothetical protein
MRATEIIRGLLDLIDSIDAGKPQDSGVEADVTITAPDGDVNRFKHIVDLLSTQPYSTTPEPKILPIDAVTTDAGGGVNGPKHPRDLRGNSFPIYPEE